MAVALTVSMVDDMLTLCFTACLLGALAMAVALTVSMADDMLTFCVFYDLFIRSTSNGGGSYCVYGG